MKLSVLLFINDKYDTIKFLGKISNLDVFKGVYMKGGNHLTIGYFDNLDNEFSYKYENK
jgi:hypothetical protein